MLTLNPIGKVRTATVHELRDIPLPPARLETDEGRVIRTGTRWKGIPHFELVSTLEGAAELYVGEHVKTELYLSADKQYLHGVIHCRGGQEGVSRCLGFRHDNLSRRSLELFTGASVWICSNGLVSASRRARYKHLRNLDFGEAIHNWVSGEGSALFNQQDGLISDLRERRFLTSASVDSALVRLGTSGAIPWRLVGRVAEKVEKPALIEHEQFRDVGAAFNLYNVINAEIKALAITRQPEALRKSLGVISEAVGIQLN